jgi:hypothetical protein
MAFVPGEGPLPLDPSVETIEVTISHPGYGAAEREALPLGIEEALFGSPDPAGNIAWHRHLNAPCAPVACTAAYVAPLQGRDV